MLAPQTRCRELADGHLLAKFDERLNAWATISNSDNSRGDNSEAELLHGMLKILQTQLNELKNAMNFDSNTREIWNVHTNHIKNRGCVHSIGNWMISNTLSHIVEDTGRVPSDKTIPYLKYLQKKCPPFLWQCSRPTAASAGVPDSANTRHYNNKNCCGACRERRKV